MRFSFDEICPTSEYILSTINQEAIFEMYMGITVDLNQKYCNPFRKDRHPDCVFRYADNGILSFIDYALGKSYNCFHIAQLKYNCTYYQTYKHIIEDFENASKFTPSVIIDYKCVAKEKIPLDLKIKSRDYTSKELDFWNIGGLNITQSILNESGIYCCETVWENDIIHDNLKFNFGYVENGEVNQIYLPMNKGTNRRRFINRTDFKLGNLKTLKQYNDVLLITKAKKDSFYLDQFEIPNIYTINEKIMLDRDCIRKLESKSGVIYTLFDNDKTGIEAGKLYEKEYGIESLLVPAKNDFSEYLQYVQYQEVIDFKEYIFNK